MHQSRHACTSSSRRSRSGSLAVASLAVAAVAASGLGAALLAPASAFAATATVGLGTAATYSVLAGQGVTNTGPTTLSADLGTSPSASVTGFPPGVVGGATHAADAAAGQAQSDLTTAYDDAAGRPTTAAVPADLVGSTLTPGVYTAAGPLGLTGTVTLDAQGDPSAVFVIQAPSSLTTGSGSRVSLVNGAQACNVFWQVSSSASLGTSSGFAGTILALTSVSVGTGATVDGRTLARNGSVTLDDDAFVSSTCGTSTSPIGSGTTPVVTPTPAPSSTPAPTPTGGSTGGTTGGTTGGSTPTPSPTPTSGTPTPTTPPGDVPPPSGHLPRTGGDGARLALELGLGAAALAAGVVAVIAVRIRRRRR
ncbi:ice-binding family protein [Clavibacter michiganensis]|uniref:ice-binding family protein n=3 Tax=Clavibacter michiganensis TaxID=28447 RepID=UPI0026DC43B2|nr:ice-binding family protein [Clavibacter michiganensis]MDO4129465.1 ice-binding family protein [Clavibacter michiganensis]MDO4135536.1 ice-binding family protein [Clavibacter michiganensis]